jgi:hypothetical protein
MDVGRRLHDWDDRENLETHERCEVYRHRGRPYPGLGAGCHRIENTVIEPPFDTLENCPPRITPSSAPCTTAMRYATERRNLDESIEELRQNADSRNDILAEAAGLTAGELVCVAVHSRRL